MTVKYDRTSVSSDKIIKHVNSLVEGQYSAELIQTNPISLEESKLNSLTELIPLLDILKSEPS